MTVTTDLVLRSPSLPLVGVAEALDLAAIEHVHRGRLQSGGQLFVAQFDAADGVSPERLSAVDEVIETTALGRASGKDVFKLVVEVDASVRRVYDADLDGAPIELPVVGPGEWRETKVFESYDTLAEFRAVCEANGIEVDLVSITSGGARADDAAAYGLTDRQYEALTLALSRGYYETPRRTSTEELGISQPSTSELLRRAERQLLSSTLGGRRVEAP